MVQVAGGCSHLRLLQNLGRWGEALVDGARREGSQPALKAAALSALSAIFTRYAVYLVALPPLVPGPRVPGAGWRVD